MIYFISDTHFNHHNILSYEPESRPFTDIHRMNEYIIMIKNHNSNSQVTFNKNIVWADDDVPELNGLDANAYELIIRCLNFSDGVYYLGTWTKFTL